MKYNIQRFIALAATTTTETAGEMVEILNDRVQYLKIRNFVFSTTVNLRLMQDGWQLWWKVDKF